MNLSDVIPAEDLAPTSCGSAPLEPTIEKIYLGQRISRQDARALYQHASLGELGKLAQFVRNRFHPNDRATFLIDRNINYTNVCNSNCSFCGFYRPDPRDPESYVNSKEVIAQKITEALELGATRILLQGGHNDELPYEYYLDLITWIHDTFPIEINAFSPSEVQQMMKVSGKSAFEVLSDLKECGLQGLPGGGAEILDDEIRKRVSPLKIRTDDWLRIMEIAQSFSLTTTATMVIGFGETIDHRLNHFERIRNLQDRSLARGYQGFNGFISWPLQANENTSLGRSTKREQYGASASEYLRNLALGRIFIDNIPHHQASWPTMGPKAAQIGLTFGADDVGSTMMEENVVSTAGGASKDRWCMSPNELKALIWEAGFTPAQRNTSFEILATFDKEHPIT